MQRPSFPIGILRTILLVSLIVSVAGCAASINFELYSTQGGQVMTGGDPERGRTAITRYGCGTCHAIPGIVGADAYVGPPLINWADRTYIAGRLTNTADNLITWIRFPQSVEPGTAMPDLGVTERDARDISAYLYTLKRR